MDTLRAMDFDPADISVMIHILAAILLIGDVEFSVGANVSW